MNLGLVVKILLFLRSYFFFYFLGFLTTIDFKMQDESFDKLKIKRFIYKTAIKNKRLHKFFI